MSLTVYRDLEQRSEPWYQARCGLVTASVVARLITVSAPAAIAYACPECAAAPEMPCVSLRNGGPIKTTHSQRVSVATDRADSAPPILTVADNDTSNGILTILAAERITGRCEDTPTTGDMWRGIVAEPFARDAYADHRRVSVEEVGLMVRTFDGVRLGYSPDGLVGDDGLIEVKAPRAKGHIDTVLNGEIPSAYMAQLQTALLVSGRPWIDYVSFHGGLHLWVKRVEPDADWQSAILAALDHAEAAITDRIARYTLATEGLPLTEPLPDYDAITI